MANFNLKENEVYLIKDGKPRLVDKPATGFGKTTIHWQDNKPISQEIMYTKRMNEN